MVSSIISYCLMVFKWWKKRLFCLQVLVFRLMGSSIRLGCFVTFFPTEGTWGKKANPNFLGNQKNDEKWKVMFFGFFCELFLWCSGGRPVFGPIQGDSEEMRVFEGSRFDETLILWWGADGIAAFTFVHDSQAEWDVSSIDIWVNCNNSLTWSK
jgi:hypothetical protein